ncbi:MAG: DUF2244 domain-containing protein [Pseudomonadota bacterium]
MRRVKNLETMPPDEKGRALAGAPSDERDVAVDPRDAPAASGTGSASSRADHQTFFDAVLYPNRSLPDSGFRAVMAVVVLSNIFFGVYFYTLGAWPVIGFCGLDILIVWLAFKISYRQGRLKERVRVTADELTVSRILPSGHESRWRLHPYWTRVHCDEPAEHESQVKVTSKGKTLILGAFLSPPERSRFAKALSEALGQARNPG